jgi:hypothetical protein
MVIRFDITVLQFVNGVKEEKIQFVVIKLFKQGEPILNTFNLFSKGGELLTQTLVSF